MRWVLFGGILAGGAIAAIMKSRDPNTLEALRISLEQTKEQARAALDNVKAQKTLMTEDVRGLFRDAVEEGQRASARRMADLRNRLGELQRGQARRPLDSQA